MKKSVIATNAFIAGMKLWAKKALKWSIVQFTRLNLLEMRSTCTRKENNMKKGKSSCFAQAVSWILFCPRECSCCTTADNVLQKSCSKSRRSFTSQRNTCFDKCPSLWIPVAFVFSLIQTFFGRGVTRQDKKSAILCLGTWSSVLRFYASEYCSEPLVSSVIESFIYFVIDFVVVRFFFIFIVQGGPKRRKCYLF